MSGALEKSLAILEYLTNFPDGVPLVRIATGRDAADTAFLDNHGGDVVLNSYQVSAVVSGDLPIDDHAEQVQLR